MYASDGLRTYRRARTAFSVKVYGLLILWLVLALIQWIVVSLVEDARTDFKKYYYISLVAFGLAVLLLAIFIFADGLRFMQFLNFIISFIIVELQIVATFLLVVHSWWADVIVFFVVSVLLVFIFLGIGIVLPRTIDFTLDIAVLFIIAFIFLIIAIFALALQMSLWFPKMYTYLVVELAVTLTILLFVIYHAQTIHGNRFAEMRLNDFFLGSLILFHDFLIIFWLTFYWQIHYRPITPDSWTASSSSPNKALALSKVPEDWELQHEPILTEPPVEDGRGIEFSETDDPDRAREVSEDQEEDSSQNRQISRNRDSESPGNDRQDQGNYETRMTASDWSVFNGRTKANHEVDDQPVQQIQKPPRAPGDFRSPGVLYKVKPIDGSQFPEPKREDQNVYFQRNQKIGSKSEYGGAKGKPKAGIGNTSIDFSLADRPPENDPASNKWVAPHYEINKVGQFTDIEIENPEEVLQENNTAPAAKKPHLSGEEMQGSRGAAQPLPDWEVLSQRELKNISDSKILRGRKPIHEGPNLRRTKASHDIDGQPVRQIQKSPKAHGDFRRPEVLYKVKPIDGSQFPKPKEEDQNINFQRNKKIGSISEYGDAKGKPKAGFGNPSIDFPLAVLRSEDDPASDKWDESHYEVNKVGRYPDITDEVENPEEVLQENKTAAKKPNLFGDEMQGSRGAAQPLPDWEVLSQEELKNLSDSRVHRGKKTYLANPLAEPLTTGRSYVPRRLPDFQRLVMNDTIVAN